MLLTRPKNALHHFSTAVREFRPQKLCSTHTALETNEASLDELLDALDALLPDCAEAELPVPDRDDEPLTDDDDPPALDDPPPDASDSESDELVAVSESLDDELAPCRLLVGSDKSDMRGGEPFSFASSTAFCVPKCWWCLPDPDCCCWWRTAAAAGEWRARSSSTSP